MFRTIFQRWLLVVLSTVFLILLISAVFNHDSISIRWKAIQRPGHKQNPQAPWKRRTVVENAYTPLVKDNFPAATQMPLPPIPTWNALPVPHPTERTPLLVGFTRNWPLLQQTVVSYITAGWPPQDIYVVENTGAMDSNKKGKLGLQNPFFLNYTRLAMLGVNVVRTPTLLNFAQLQNFYLSYAIDEQLPAYFWSHMDVIALSDETTSIYRRALEIYRKQIETDKWAGVFFAYDRLALVNTQAYIDVGGWDTFIGYYMTDCDFHERARMQDFHYDDEFVGYIFDVGRSLDDLEILYRQGHQAKDAGFHDLFAECDKIQREKNEDKRGRNFWQATQQGGIGEPFYRDPAGFEKAIHLSIEQGRTMFAEKWGHRDCDLVKNGLKTSDAWRVKKDFWL